MTATILPAHEALAQLKDAGFPVVPQRTIGSLAEALEFARVHGYPLALKFSTARFSHKTEVGGLRLHLQNEVDLEQAFRELSQRGRELDPTGVFTVETMAGPGAEFFLGFERREGFGPILSFGLGGIWLELLQDVTFRLLPAGRLDLEDMLAEVKSWARLKAGFRHLPPVEADAIVNVMEQTAAFVLARPEIQAMDLNPLIANGDQVVLVDARMVLESDADHQGG